MQKYRKKLTNLLLAVSITFSVAMMLSVISITFAMTSSAFGFIIGPACAFGAVIAYIRGFVYIYQLNQHSI